MPLDGTGASAPASPWAERLARLKIIRRKSQSEERRQRRFSKRRLETAEELLGHIIADADFVGEGVIAERYRDRPVVYLLVALHPRDFEDLCEVGAELEDLEENGDSECGADPEHSLVMATGADWAGGHGSLDYDYEAAIPLPPEKIAAARERYHAKRNTPRDLTDPAGRVGRWQMLRRVVR